MIGGVDTPIYDNKALADYAKRHPGFVADNDLSNDYRDLRASVVDYTPRMITQMISSSYTDPVVKAAHVSGNVALNGTANANTVMGVQGANNHETLTITVDGVATIFEFINSNATPISRMRTAT